MKKLEEEYEEIQPKIYAFFYAKTGNQATAQDLCHDTFYEACKTSHHLLAIPPYRLGYFQLSRTY
ncbi:hypothetical protein J1P26_24515 [Neobacillus sp. MM2021_6]|uniref:hypothetical protein n=1 Tax=Bacillaceae TaxID=186817 RepID=UPI00140E4927|nr:MULTISPECIES: hypothetical protein [Bacillaceae]MBO0962839.1 hypothetical protein [Neobacillus sp. MM2021_6]NHC21508.1 hypothetical protein [Bacillus sp. MM2020_4]